MIAATGLLAEAQIAASSAKVKTVVSAGNATRLGALIEEAIAEGGVAILSFGIAGGLREALKPATCLVGGEVVHAGKVYRADAVWTARLAKRLITSGCEGFESERGGNAERRRGEGRPALHRIAGVDRPVASPCDKRALQAATGASAVDMESHIVADLAARHGLPFAVVRVIADPVNHGIPPAAQVAMRSDGAMDAIACLRAVARHPVEVPALIRLAIDTVRAMLQLRRCAKVLGPGLGFFERG